MVRVVYSHHWFLLLISFVFAMYPLSILKNIYCASTGLVFCFIFCVLNKHWRDNIPDTVISAIYPRLIPAQRMGSGEEPQFILAEHSVLNLHLTLTICFEVNSRIIPILQIRKQISVFAQYYSAGQH